MTKHILFIFLISIINIFADVNIRVVYVSNLYNNPSPGNGILTFDVEALSDAGDVAINVFQDAIGLDATFDSQVPLVSFSNQLFPSTSYNTVENQVDDGTTSRIRFQYTFNNTLPRSVISGTSWTVIVRITIQYTMAAVNGAIFWSDGLPTYFVTDLNSTPITGTEGAIPSQLQVIPLPVELSAFTASINQSAVNLKWQTKTETNNYGFEVERASSMTSPSKVWKKIGFINGHGNSNAPIDYSYVDKNPFSGSKVSYRLKQIDTDGTFEYSKEVEVELIPNEFSLFQNYPNPFNPSTTIKFALPKTAKVSLIVYNLVGEKVATLLDENKDAGYYDIQFNSDNLSSGVYIYRLTAENFVQTKKMTLIR